MSTNTPSTSTLTTLTNDNGAVLILTDQDITQLASQLHQNPTQLKPLFQMPNQLGVLKVDELKTILQYLKEAKNMKRVTKSGNKAQLVDRIKEFAYAPKNTTAPTPPPTPATQSHLMQNGKVKLSDAKPTTVQIPGLGSSSAPPTALELAVRSPITTTSKVIATRQTTMGVPSRRLSGEEENFLTVLRHDMTLGGKIAIDPFNEVQRIADVHRLSRRAPNAPDKYNFSFNLQQEFLDHKGRDSNYAVHVVLFDKEYKPMSWPREAEVVANMARMELPRPLKKVDAKKSKKVYLLSPSPLEIPIRHLKHHNTVDIHIARHFSIDAFVVVLCVRINQLEQLVAQVKSHAKDVPTPTAPTVTDDDILESDEVVSLKDPLTLIRINTPAKGENCIHKACFDLETFLNFSHRNLFWNCALCDKPLPFSTLYIDPLMSKILQSTDAETDKVILHQDGTFEKVNPARRERENLALISGSHSTVSKKRPRTETAPDNNLRSPKIPAIEPLRITTPAAAMIAVDSDDNANNDRESDSNSEAGDKDDDDDYSDDDDDDEDDDNDSGIRSKKSASALNPSTPLTPLSASTTPASPSLLSGTTARTRLSLATNSSSTTPLYNRAWTSPPPTSAAGVNRGTSEDPICIE